MQPNTNLARIDDTALEVRPYFGDDFAEFTEILAINMGRRAAFSLSDIERVKFPGAGSLSWRIPDVEKWRTVEEFEGVILDWREHRGYFETKYDGDNKAPDCGAEEPGDNEEWHGTAAFNGKYGGACATCPASKWRRTDTGRYIPPACRPRIRVYIQTRESAYPLWIDLPSTSVQIFRDYMKALTKIRMRYFGVVTRFCLEEATSTPPEGSKNKQGIAFAKLKPRVLRNADETIFRFSNSEMVAIADRRRALMAVLDQARHDLREGPPAHDGPPASAAEAYGLDEENDAPITDEL